MPHLLRVESVRLRNFRLFEELEVRLNRRLTVVHAENAGGKSALLGGIGVALGAALYERAGAIEQTDVRSELSDRSMTAISHYPARVEAQGVVAGEPVLWARELTRPGRRTTNAEAKSVRAELNRVWTDPNAPWPVVAYYGTQRLWGVVKQTKRRRGRTAREDGYVDALDPRSKERQLLDWLYRASIAKLQRKVIPGEFLAVERALATALRHPSDDGEFAVREIEYDIGSDEPILLTQHGRRRRWSQLSDGEHVFAGLVADLARRCVTLNPQLGERAVLSAQGVVLIDEVDLHLHPRWQRVVLPRLLAAFPELQFVVSTHSPQVLSSVENDQVILLRAGRALPRAAVHGRDSNSILREVFGASDRAEDTEPAAKLRQLHQAIEQRKFELAHRLLGELRGAWTGHDPEVVRAERVLSWAESE